jgi:hypothetical protein
MLQPVAYARVRQRQPGPPQRRAVPLLPHSRRPQGPTRLLERLQSLCKIGGSLPVSGRLRHVVRKVPHDAEEVNPIAVFPRYNSLPICSI